jgi:hypothetical protein
LKLANGHAAKGDQFSFMRLAAEVGRTKPDHEAGTRQDRSSRS